MQQSETEAAQKANVRNTVSKPQASHFFMSANTPSGYVSDFNKLYDPKTDWKAYILKSVPGIAPLLLPKVGEKFEEAGIAVEYIHCVLQPQAVAALVLPERKICIIDGMPPHNIEASFPGIIEEEIMLCEPDTSALFEKRKEILLFSSRSSALYDRVYRFLSAASSLQNDIMRIASESLDSGAIEKYTTGLAKRLFTPIKGTGRVYQRYLSGITPDGITSFYDKLAPSYSRIYAIEDEYGVGSLLIKELEKKATIFGHDVIVCNCPVLGTPEHLFIPDLSIAFVTSNSHHRTDGKACRHINIKRFTDYDTLRLKKARIGFNRRASRELYEQAVSLLVEAKANDDIMRDCYLPSINLETAEKRINVLCENIILNN